MLLSLLSNTINLSVKWQGPCTVTPCQGKVNYEIVMPDQGGSKSVFHINMLRKWYQHPTRATGKSDCSQQKEETCWVDREAEMFD